MNEWFFDSLTFPLRYLISFMKHYLRIRQFFFCSIVYINKYLRTLLIYELLPSLNNQPN